MDEIIRSILKKPEQVVETSIAMTAAQVKQFNGLEKLTLEADAMENKRKTMRKLFWAQIEIALDNFDSDMRVSV